jgi:hypothetical protein
MFGKKVKLIQIGEGISFVQDNKGKIDAVPNPLLHGAKIVGNDFLKIELPVVEGGVMIQFVEINKN